MTDRSRTRVGREVRYFPTAAEETAGGGAGPFPAKIAKINADGTANLTIYEPDGTLLAKTDVQRGQRVGRYSILSGPAAI